MKVLMLGWELPPYNSGGLGVACLQLSQALAASGADIDFVLPYYPGPGFEHMRVKTAFTEPADIYSFESVYQTRGFDKKSKKPKSIDFQSAFEDAVSYIASSGEYDVIHAHDWLTFRAALRAKWESGTPLVVHIHSIERDRAGGKEGSSVVRDIEGTALALADKVVAVSEHTKQAIVEDYGIPSDKIQVVHNGIDPNDFLPLDEDNSYRYLAEIQKHGWRVLTYVGRLTVQKGLTQMIRAVAESMKQFPKTILLLVGSGEQRDELVQLAADLGIGDRIFFADFQRGKRLRDAFKSAGLFLMPSVSEPFGLVALEAAGYGAPVLLSKQSGVSEVLKSCLKVDYWDIDEMANKITAVLQNPVLGEELSRNARFELDQLTWERPAQKIMNLYQTHARQSA